MTRTTITARVVSGHWVPVFQPDQRRASIEIGTGVTDWQSLSDEVTSRLLAGHAGTAVAFAVVTAERLMRLDPLRLPFTQLSHAQSGLPIDQQEHLLTALRGIVTVPATPSNP